MTPYKLRDKAGIQTRSVRFHPKHEAEFPLHMASLLSHHLRMSKAAATCLVGLEGCPACWSVPSTLKCPSHGCMEMCTYHVRKAPGESHVRKLIGWGPCPRTGGGHRRCECGPWTERNLLEPCVVEAHSHALISAQAPGAEEPRASFPHFTCRSPLTTL